MDCRQLTSETALSLSIHASIFSLVTVYTWVEEREGGEREGGYDQGCGGGRV